jgi:hypothetical protein
VNADVIGRKRLHEPQQAGAAVATLSDEAGVHRHVGHPHQSTGKIVAKPKMRDHSPPLVRHIE